tara:strand:+ start:112 stop:501 length:390 start_codon:yes stop_codon:yes gene_type:complete
MGCAIITGHLGVVGSSVSKILKQNTGLKIAGIDCDLRSQLFDEVGRREDTGEIVVRVDPRYFRPTEVSTLLGDPLKAKEKLGWVPKISLEELIDEMITFDKNEASKEFLLKKEGFEVYGSIENPPNSNI